MSFGVDIVAHKYKECTEDNFNGKYYINSTCPSIVNLVEKFYPELVGNLVPTVTPVAATAIALRKIYGENLKIVHITPCIAAKKEVDRLHGLAQVNAVLTFRELRKLFFEFNIKETFSEFSDFDEPLGNKGGLYAHCGRVLWKLQVWNRTSERKNDFGRGKEEFIAASKGNLLNIMKKLSGI